MVALTVLLLLLRAGDDLPNPRHGEDPNGGYGVFGRGLACLGDLDGDGRSEFSVSDPWSCRPPTVWILSGADAHVVDRLSDEDCERQFGTAVGSIPDVDHDGVDDLAIVSAPDWESCALPCVTLFSGRTRARLRTLGCPPNVIGFGTRVAGLPDVDGDGCGDVLVGAGGRDTLRCGFVFSGATGRLLFELWAPREVKFPDVAPVCDFDGDGHPELAITGTDETTTLPIAVVCSGRDGHALARLHTATRNGRFGVRAMVLDEHTPELLLAADGLVEPATQFAVPPRIQSRHVVESERLEYEASCAVLGDIDGDGQADFVVADPDEVLSIGSATCYSGGTGKVIWHQLPWPSWRNVDLYYLGRYLAVIGDFDGDGVRDFIRSTDNLDSGGPGLVFISSGRTGNTLKVLARGPKLEILRLGP